MSGLTDLINVTFVDQTSFTPEVGDDVVGCPIEHCWGPVGKLDTYNLPAFLRVFPEAFPIGASNTETNGYMNAWAQLRRALRAGAPAVETFRIQGGWLYEQMNIEDVLGTLTLVGETSATQFSADILSIATKYPGRPPKAGIYSDYNTLKFVVTLHITVVNPAEPVPQIAIEVFGVNTGGETLLESHVGDFNETSIVDGQSYFIEKVLERDSQVLAIKVNTVPVIVGADDILDYTLPTYLETFVMPTPVTPAQFLLGMTEAYSDSETSNSTMLLAPVNGDENLNAEIGRIVSVRKDCNFLIGLPLETVLTKANVETFITTGLPNASYDMFTLFIQGRELYSVCNKSLFMDCTAGWAGAIARIARMVRINQMPSARTYGSFDGVLTQSLRFEDVLALHSKGVNSVYTSTVGAQIFGIRARHPRQTSYFAKANVSRVTARFLKSVYPVILNIIHTETVSDPINLIQLEGTLQRLVGSFISQGNIGANSVVNLANNGVETSNGGEILNVDFELWFKKLTEKVNIRIIATDSSVTVNIT